MAVVSGPARTIFSRRISYRFFTLKTNSTARATDSGTLAPAADPHLPRLIHAIVTPLNALPAARTTPSRALPYLAGLSRNVPIIIFIFIYFFYIF
jgi:hypothetical protein